MARRKFDEISRAATESRNSILIKHFPSYWSDQLVRKLLETFRPLQTLGAPKNSIYMLMGFAVCEYVDSTTTDKAIMALNGIQLGDMSLSADGFRLSASLPSANGCLRYKLLPPT